MWSAHVPHAQGSLQDNAFAVYVPKEHAAELVDLHADAD